MGFLWQGVPLPAALNLVGFVGMMVLLFVCRKPRLNLSRQTLLALLLGALYGGLLQLAYGAESEVVGATLRWTNVVGTGYVNLLKMVIMPLVLVMMIGAVVRVRHVGDLGRIGGLIIGILVVTTRARRGRAASRCTASES